MQANGLPLPLGLQIGPSPSVSPFSLGKEQSGKGTERSRYPGLERPGRHLVAAVGRWPELSPPHLLAQASLLPHLHRWSLSSRSRGHHAASRPGHRMAPTHPDPWHSAGGRCAPGAWAGSSHQAPGSPLLPTRAGGAWLLSPGRRGGPAQVSRRDGLLLDTEGTHGRQQGGNKSTQRGFLIQTHFSLFKPGSNWSVGTP